MRCHGPSIPAPFGAAGRRTRRPYTENVDGVPGRAMQGEGASTGPARHRWHTRACRHGGVTHTALLRGCGRLPTVVCLIAHRYPIDHRHPCRGRACLTLRVTRA